MRLRLGGKVGSILTDLYQKDKLPDKILDGFSIINLQSSVDGSGSHWSALYHSKACDIYYDSYGF